MRHSQANRARHRAKMKVLLSIPEVIASYKDEFINLCTMQGDCIRLENTSPGHRAEFHSERAHIFAYKLFHGTIPHGMWVLHHCDNNWCVHPEHIYLGTRQDNILDAVRRERYPTLKLSLDQVATIRLAYESRGCPNGMQTELAKQYGVSTNTISSIVRYKMRNLATSSGEPIEMDGK